MEDSFLSKSDKEFYMLVSGVMSMVFITLAIIKIFGIAAGFIFLSLFWTSVTTVLYYSRKKS